MKWIHKCIWNNQSWPNYTYIIRFKEKCDPYNSRRNIFEKVQNPFMTEKNSNLGLNFLIMKNLGNKDIQQKLLLKLTCKVYPL